MSGDDDRISYLAGEDSGELGSAERAELDEVRSLLADPAMWAEPDAGLEDRVVAAVSARAGSGRPAHLRPEERDAPHDLDASRRRRTWFSPARATLVAAAAALIVVALVFALGGSDDRTTEFALSGTALRPAAEGTVRVTSETSGLRIELDATGLPRRDHGRYYQAWLKNDAGELVPIGTFHDAEDIVLWAGVSLRDYPTLTVTEEETNGDPASSGQRVLVGAAANRR